MSPHPSDLFILLIRLNLLQFFLRVLQFLARLGQLVFALVDLVRVALAHGLVQISLAAADFAFGVQHLLFLLLEQAGIGAIGGDLAQGFFQSRLLIAVTCSLGLFDLGADFLTFGSAAAQFGRLFCCEQRGCQQSTGSEHHQR